MAHAERVRGRIYDDITQTIGNTPLIRLRRVTEGCAGEVVAKLENFNPLWSVKDRIGVAMIDAAEKAGKIRPDTLIVEADQRQHRHRPGLHLRGRGATGCTVTMPESMSVERRRLLKAFGAEIVLTPATEGMPGAVRPRRGDRLEHPPRLHAPAVQEPGQPGDPPRDHGRGDLATTPRAGSTSSWCGVGTGGTITGCGEVLKAAQARREGHRRGADANSPVLTQRLARAERLKPGRHAIQGIGAGFVPDILNMSR